MPFCKEARQVIAEQTSQLTELATKLTDLNIAHTNLLAKHLLCPHMSYRTGEATCLIRSNKLCPSGGSPRSCPLRNL